MDEDVPVRLGPARCLGRRKGGGAACRRRALPLVAVGRQCAGLDP